MKKQNIEGGFPDSSGEVFTGEQIEFLFDQDVEFDYWGRIDTEDGTAQLCWNDPQPGHKYYHGWDLAKHQDWTVGFTIDVMKNPWQIMAYERFHHRPWPYVYERIRHRHKLYGSKGISETWIDCTGVGDVVLDELQDIQAQGFNFGGGKAKVNMLINAQTMLQNKTLKSPWIKQCVDEFNFYEWDDEDLTQDCVMGLGVALWGARDLGLPLNKETRELLRRASMYA
jgi:virulence-associated protein VapD